MDTKRFNKLKYFPILVILFFINLKCSISEMRHMKDLMETEAELNLHLKKFIHEFEYKVDYIKKIFKTYQPEYRRAAHDPDGYTSNPVTAYLLTKRLAVDWMQINTIMMETQHTAMLYAEEFKEKLKLPSEDDVSEAALSIIRLQDFYNISTTDLADGNISGIIYSKGLSWDDCVELGKQLMENNEYKYAIAWIEEARGRVNRNTSFDINASQAYILEHLLNATYKSGDEEKAFKLSKKLLKMKPDEERIKRLYDFHKASYEKFWRDHSEDCSPEVHRKLCRGELDLDVKIQRTLRCRYFTGNEPFLKLAPLKMEEALLDPLVMVFHNVISDNEMEFLKNASKDILELAKVIDPDNDIDINYRSSRVAWLNGDKHKIVGDVIKRAGDMAGLDVESSEELQVNNYAIGGHYNVHVDGFEPEDEDSLYPNGNRVATVLFYLNEVEKGGYTVFPKINVTVVPEKGSASVWYSTYLSGNLDYRTLHAGCPVLLGSKWVANLWLHEVGQEFKRPCGLSEHV